MTCSLSVGAKAFADNPIQLEVLAADHATYQVVCNGSVAFRGISSGSFTANISEVLRGKFTDVNTWVSSASGYPYLLTPYRTTDHILPVLVTVTDSDGTTWSKQFTAVRGGIPKRLFRSMEEEYTTFFAKKDVVNGNFFFTIRANGWRISIKETELDTPLMFFMPSGGTGNIDIHAFDDLSQTLTLSGTPGNLYGLDIKAIRNYFLTQYGTICNCFRIYTEVSGPSLTLASCIAIEQAVPSPERYLIRFRSSLGFYECIELAGRAVMTADAEADTEESTVSLQYDPLTDSYVNIRERQSVVESITVPSGIKRIPEILMLRDMLASDDVRLVVDDEEWRVIPSCEELNVPLLPTEPQSYDITLRMVEGESLTGFCFTDGNFVRPRLFAAQYAAQFE